MIGLTRQQLRCLQFIETRMFATNGIAPSVDEIRDHLGIASKTGVLWLLRNLEERGRIRRFPNRARAIEVIKPSLTPSINGEPLRFIPLHHLPVLADA